MESGVISDSIIKTNSDDHSTIYSPQSARLDTSQLHGWLPYTPADSNIGKKSSIFFQFEDLMTIGGIDIQQGDLNGATLFNKIMFGSISYWHPNPYISYGPTDKSNDGIPLVCFIFYLLIFIPFRKL